MGGMSDTDEGSMSEVEVPGTLNSELRTSNFGSRLSRTTRASRATMQGADGLFSILLALVARFTPSV